jgi:hypothetical protein
MALMRVGRWERAREEFARVDYYMSHFGLAQVHEKTGAVAEAAREYRLFLEQWNELKHNPILLRAADVQSNLVGRAQAFVEAHFDSPDPGPPSP